MLLSQTTTVHAVLEEYPFLERFFLGRHEAFAPLARPGRWRTWARVTTLGHVATLMDEPCVALLREIRAEVLRVQGTAPAIAAEGGGPAADPRLGDELRALVARLEEGAPLAELSRRVDELTSGIDAEALSDVAHEAETGRVAALFETASDAARGDSPQLSLYPGHPVRALGQESARLAGVADHVEDALASLGEPPDPGRWQEAGPVVRALLERLAELERQAHRLRLAWYPTLARCGARSTAAVVEDRLAEAVAGVRRLRRLARKDDPVPLATAVPRTLHLVRHALLVEEELLVPVALRELDDGDWEAVAGQERVVGWALGPGARPPEAGPGPASRGAR